MTEHVGSLNDENLLNLAAMFCDGVMGSRDPDEIIHREGETETYLRRWFLARKNKVPQQSFERFDKNEAFQMVPSIVENVYIHRFGEGDANETLHDHPWSNASLIVSGGYIEQTPDALVHRLPGDVIIRGAEDRHAIRDVMPNTVTIFGTGVKQREWGFWLDDRFVHWRDYHSNAPSKECRM